MSTDTIRMIARNELSNIVRHPLVILVTIVLCVIILVNSAGCSILLPELRIVWGMDSFLLGISNSYYDVSFILCFLSMCLSIISISGDGNNGSLSVLLTKPVYRRDVLVGKFLGINVFIFLLATFILAIDVSSIMVFYRGPESISAYFQLVAFLLVLYVFCTQVSGIMFLLGTLIKELPAALAVAMSCVYILWNVKFPATFKDLALMIHPRYMYLHAIGGNNGLLYPPGTLSGWFNDSFSMVVLMIMEAVVMFLGACILFSREEV